MIKKIQDDGFKIQDFPSSMNNVQLAINWENLES